MFDINGGEFVVLAGVALIVLGPDKLPGYAAQAARLVRQLREMADGAKDQMREQMGPEFDDVDWKALDPRQYDPRRIVRDALLGGDDEDEPGLREPGSNGSAKSRSAGGPTDQSAAGVDGDRPANQGDAEPAGGQAPAAYDDEAT